MVPNKTMHEFNCNGNETSISSCTHNQSDSCRIENRTIEQFFTIDQSEIRNWTYNRESGAGVECTSEEQGKDITWT